MTDRFSRRAWFGLAITVLSVTSPAAVPAHAAEQRTDFNGIWDLTWQTDKGPVRKGDMEIVQSGNDLTLAIHGKTTIKADGRADGQNFLVRGSRFLISYTVIGKVAGNAMTGSLKIMSSEKPFTAERRAH